MTPHIEYLGYRVIPPQGVHHAYVAWLPERDLLRSIVRLAAQGFACPECGRPWAFARARGVMACLSHHSAMRVAKVSDSCPSCGAIVHWDRTDEGRRPRLTWVHLYDRAPDVMGPRVTRLVGGARG